MWARRPAEERLAEVEKVMRERAKVASMARPCGGPRDSLGAKRARGEA